MLKGNRKFVVVMAALLLGSLLAVLGKLSGEFVTIASVSVGAFAASNAYEHHTKSKAPE